MGYGGLKVPSYGGQRYGGGGYGGYGGGGMGGGLGGGMGGGGMGGGGMNPSQMNAYAKSNMAGGGGVQGGGGQGFPQMPYQPQGPNVQNLINPLAEAGKGLLDPSSGYSQRMRTELSEDIGGQSEAQQRLAALQAARGGMGAGASPELLETQGDIGRSGLEAYGDASARAMLGGMELGGSMLSPAISGQLGLQGQQLSGYLAQQQGLQDQESQRFQAMLQQQRMQQEMMLRQLSMMGGY